MKSHAVKESKTAAGLSVLKENPTKALIAVAVFLSTFGASNASFDVLGFKLSLFRFVVMVLFVIVVVRLVRGDGVKRAFDSSAWLSLCFLVVFVGYAAISGLWAHDYAKWIRHVYYLFICLVLAVSMCIELKSPRDFRIVALAFVLSCAVQASIGAFELVSHKYFFITEEMFEVMNTRNKWYPIALGGGINGLATILSIGVAYCVIAYKLLGKTLRSCFSESQSSKTGVLQCVIIAAAVFFAVLVFASKSRACILSLLAVALVLIACSKHRKPLLIAAGVCLVIMLVVFWSQIVGLLGINLNAPEGSSDSIRVHLIANGLDAVRSTFGFGVGAGQVDYWIKTHEAFNVAGIYQMHNMWLEVLVTYGALIWIGFIAFYAKLVIDFIKAFRDKKRSTAVRLGSVGFLTLLTVIAVANLALGSFVTKEWLMCSFALCVAWQATIGCNMADGYAEDKGQATQPGD